MKFLLLIFMKTIIVFENGLKSGNVYFFFTQNNLKIIETTILYRRQKQFYQIFMFCQSNILILKIQRYCM